MDSNSFNRNAWSQLYEQEQYNYTHQQQTVNPMDLDNRAFDPYLVHDHFSSLAGYKPAGMNPSTSPESGQSASPSQGQATVVKHTTPRPPPDPRYNNNGRTGKPKGRPAGAKNKPRAPDHGLPKVAKKKGRPPGAKDIRLRRPPRPRSSLPAGESSSPIVAAGSAQEAMATVAGTPPLPVGPSTRPADAPKPSPYVDSPAANVMLSSTPADDPPVFAPNGYAPATGFRLDPHDSGYDTETGDGYSISRRARELENPEQDGAEWDRMGQWLLDDMADDRRASESSLGSTLAGSGELVTRGAIPSPAQPVSFFADNPFSNNGNSNSNNYNNGNNGNSNYNSNYTNSNYSNNTYTFNNYNTYNTYNT